MNHLSQAQREAEQYINQGRLISPDNFHITLHFIGDVDPSEIEQFAGYLDEAARNVPSVLASFPSFGSFRRGKRELIFVSVKDKNGGHGFPEMNALAGSLKTLSQMGDLKDFRPHVTIIRNGELEKQRLAALKNHRLSSKLFPITAAALMESTRIDGKLTYIPLHTVELK